MGKWLHDRTNTDFWYSLDEFDTKEEAILDGIQQYKDALAGKRTDLFDDDYPNPPSGVFDVGKKFKFVPYIDADIVIEKIQEQAYEEVGEIAEDYLYDVSKEDMRELQIELQTVFDSWMNRHKYNPWFYSIRNVEQICAEDYM